MNKKTVEIQNPTTLNPITIVGEEAGITWGGDLTSTERNHKRGVECIQSNHGRDMEYPRIYMVLDGWSDDEIKELNLKECVK